MWSGSWIGRWLNREEESSTSGSEDSFAINVLLEPFPAEQAAPHQAVLSGEAPSLGVVPPEASSSSPHQDIDWRAALDLPGTTKAPESLRAHVKDELVALFNIGKKRNLPDKYINK